MTRRVVVAVVVAVVDGVVAGDGRRVASAAAAGAMPRRPVPVSACAYERR